MKKVIDKFYLIVVAAVLYSHMVVAVTGLVKVEKTSGKSAQMGLNAPRSASDALNMVTAGIDNTISGDGFTHLRGAPGTLEYAVY